MVSKIAKFVAVALVVSLALEVGLFNVKHWETLGNAETPVAMSQSEDGSRVTYSTQVDNASVNSIAFDLDYSSDVAVDVTIKVSDSGNSATEYDLPQVTYYSAGRKYLTVDAYGYVKSLSITVEQPSDVTVRIKNVSLNPQIPFAFEVKRFILAFVLLLIIGALWPRSPLWQARMNEQGLLARAVPAAALVVAVFFALISFAGPTDDVEADWYWTFAYDEYTELAHSFAKGELYLEEEPPTWLDEMDDQSAGEGRLLGESNVYDSSQREIHVAETNQYCKDDAAYYNGHYYVYFGVVPVVLLYLPFYLVTGLDMSNAFAALLVALLFIVFSWLLLRELCARWFARASVGMFVTSFALLLCASEIVFTLARPQLYNLPSAWSMMFAVLGLWLLAKGYTAKSTGGSCAFLLFGALSIALIAGCRPQLLLVGAAIIWVGWKLAHRDKGRKRVAHIACLIVPVCAVAVALMWYNYARFGSVTDFGANYNLAGNDMTLREFSVVRSLEGLVFYLFSTPHVTTAFPFFEPFYAEPSYMSINMSEPMVMGVFIQCPLLFAIAYYLVVRRGDARWGAVGWLALSGAVIAIFDANAAGLLGRYAQDFGVFFGLGGALVLLDADARNQVAGLVKALVSTLAIAMVLFTVTARLSLMSSSSIPSGPRESTVMMKEAQPLFEFWR